MAFEYELKTSSVVDALNYLDVSLAGGDVAVGPPSPANTVIEALNNICVTLDGEGQHLYAPDAIYEIADLLSNLLFSQGIGANDK